MWGLLDWFETHQGAAAWTQAVFSVVAILIAIAVPAWQEALRRRDESAAEKRRAQGLSLVIYLEVIGLMDVISRTYKLEHPSLEEVAVPEILDEQLENLWHMGPTGGHLLNLLGNLRAQNRIARRNMVMIGGSRRPDTMNKLNELARARLEVAHKDCRDAIAGMEKLIGVPAQGHEKSPALRG